MGEEIPSGTKWGVRWSSTPRLSKTSPYRLGENWTHLIASLNSNSQVLTEPVSLPGVPCRLDKAAAYCPQDGSSGPTMHTLPSFQLQLAQTDVPLQEMRIYGSYASQRSLQLHVPASIADLTRCTLTKVSTHVKSQTKLLPPLNRKSVIPSGREPSPLSNPGCSRTDGTTAFWNTLLITSFIAECLGKRPALYLQDKPCKPLLSILPPQWQ